MNATLIIPRDERLLTLFAPESRTIGRGCYELVDDGNDLLFTMVAPDAASMRAVFNAVTKVLQAWEVTEGL